MIAAVEGAISVSFSASSDGSAHLKGTIISSSSRPAGPPVGSLQPEQTSHVWCRSKKLRGSVHIGTITKQKINRARITKIGISCCCTMVQVEDCQHKQAYAPTVAVRRGRCRCRQALCLPASPASALSRMALMATRPASVFSRMAPSGNSCSRARG